MIIMIILLLVFRKLLEKYRRFVLKNNSDIRNGLSCLNHELRVSSVLDLASAVNSFCVSKQWHLMLLNPFGSMVYTITNVLYILVHAVGKPGSGIWEWHGATGRTVLFISRSHRNRLNQASELTPFLPSTFVEVTDRIELIQPFLLPSEWTEPDGRMCKYRFW